VYINVCPTEPGTLTNTATLSSDTPDPDLANNTATETTTVISETSEPCPEPDDPGPFEPPFGNGDGSDSLSEEQLTTVNPTTIFAPSLEADQTTDQDSGDVDQLMEDSPGGTPRGQHR
jgi:hypothetical protein